MAFIFLASTPLLGILLFRSGAFSGLLKILGSALVWIGSFLWFAKTYGLPEQHLLALSLIPVVLLLFPWVKTWKSWRHYRNRQQLKRGEANKVHQAEEQAQLKQAQEQENEALLRDLIRDLGK